MKLVILTHPKFLKLRSISKYTSMLADGMLARGHEVEVWSPVGRLFNFPLPQRLKKWLGYIDQYIIYPFEIKNKLKGLPGDVLFVFSDQALGPWVSLVADRLNVIHCHDFLAQRSAIGKVAENQTSLTGRLYQSYIRSGYRKGKNFISVSDKTQADLEWFLDKRPLISERIYNGLERLFQPAPVSICRAELGKLMGIDLSKGYILHVGGNQWYKNRLGVISIYNKWRSMYSTDIPLVLIGEAPTSKLSRKANESNYSQDIYFLNGISDEMVQAAYAGAEVFLFPSIAEGFGWPIVEAMASGAIVVTTDDAPMSEVAADAAFLIKKLPEEESLKNKWVSECALVLQKAMSLNQEQRAAYIAKAEINASRFDLDNALNEIERVYKKITDDYNSSHSSEPRS